MKKILKYKELNENKFFYKNINDVLEIYQNIKMKE